MLGATQFIIFALVAIAATFLLVLVLPCYILDDAGELKKLTDAQRNQIIQFLQNKGYMKIQLRPEYSETHSVIVYATCGESRQRIKIYFDKDYNFKKIKGPSSDEIAKIDIEIMREPSFKFE